MSESEPIFTLTKSADGFLFQFRDLTGAAGHIKADSLTEALIGILAQRPDRPQPIPDGLCRLERVVDIFDDEGELGGPVYIPAFCVLSWAPAKVHESRPATEEELAEYPDYETVNYETDCTAVVVGLLGAANVINVRETASEVEAEWRRAGGADLGRPMR